MERNSFVLYCDYAEYLNELTDEEVGQLTRAIFQYAATGEEPAFRGVLKLAWIAIRQGMDRNSDRYERRASAGRRGGRPKKDEDPAEPADEPSEEESAPETPPKKTKKANESKDTNAFEKKSKETNAFECFSDEKANESKDTNAFESDGVRVRERERVRDPVRVRDRERERERERAPAAAGADPRTPRGKYGHVLLSESELKELCALCGKELSFTTPDELIRTLDEYIEAKPEYKSANHLITLKGWVADKVAEQHKKDRPKERSFSASDVSAYEEWGKKKVRGET
ncbi:MAG: hypothetical protein IJL83_02195 [Clostridia bacterium]|nr:hypothetical protein [Clostridia bacterium]